MAVSFYPAILEKEEDSDFCVFFPDLPGCVAAGDDIAEALQNAEDALQFHIEGLIHHGESVPDPSHPDTLKPDPEVNVLGVYFVRFRVGRKSKRVNITLDELLLREIDEAADDRGDTRSGFLAEAARRLVREG